MQHDADTSNPVHYVLKDCGVHWGPTPGPCAKCGTDHGHKYRSSLQAGGTPAVALIGPAVEHKDSWPVPRKRS